MSDARRNPSGPLAIKRHSQQATRGPPGRGKPFNTSGQGECPGRIESGSIEKDHTTLNKIGEIVKIKCFMICFQNLAQAAAPPLPLLQASRFHPPRVGPLAPPPPLPPNHSRTTGSLVAPSSSAALVRPTSFQPALEPVPSAYPGVTGYLATNPFLSMLTPPSSQGTQNTKRFPSRQPTFV